MIALFALALAADAATFLALPSGGEANPLVVSLLAVSPWVAVLAKVAIGSWVTAAVEGYARRYRRLVYAVGAAAWTFGAVTNLATIWR